MAERVRFELTVVLPTHAFQACAINHSAISPPRPTLSLMLAHFSIQNEMMSFTNFSIGRDTVRSGFGETVSNHSQAECFFT